MTDATADAAGEEEAPRKKGSKLPLLIGLLLALLGGGGGFYAAFSGMLPFGGAAGGDAHAAARHDTAAGGDGAHGGEDAGSHGDGGAAVGFIELPQLIASLGPVSALHHLRFSAQLEVVPERRAQVEQLMPRILDVLNTYLRALEPGDIEAQGALIRLRAQMLRRIQMVAGEDSVRDLLVTEFVLN
ncbi:flagellar basal body-associated protein FliL [Salipiger sp. PrR002]|uniref:flagellar basal body-associated FliL family protein n=1 Tax=Salipiger sp. PrR002 TaxID=2706489 RepID=UPI0013B9DB50|nr:flagellar basal body-associated FliL family protein [Salipiger sp. PrR002]NDV98983.1 flagellar basal body-associated FliL family protein [Salipiger sp. PrR002]NDW55936.1 flagellar basal body-associated FliL family protein [Salipiger sp. PrR004]